jgi:hypothetical protein
MGATNVRLAFALWGELPATPFRALVFMALTSLDEDSERTKARRYFAGREALAVALGRNIPDAPQDDDESPAAISARRVRHTAFVTVQANLSTLTTARAITPIRKGRPGRQAEYELNLAPFPKQGHLVSEDKVRSPAKQGEVVEWDKPTLSRMSTKEPLNEPGIGQSAISPSSHQAPVNPVDDDGYLAARKTLDRQGPERMQQLLDDVTADHPDASARELVFIAAERAALAVDPWTAIHGRRSS